MYNSDKIRADKRFLSSIPLAKRQEVLDKAAAFSTTLKECKGFSDIPRSFYVRHVEGTKIFKLRVNKSERILYRYEEESGQPIFISFCNHDEQIRFAHAYLGSEEIKEIACNTEFDETEWEAQLDEYIRYQFDEEMLLLEQEILLDDEGIVLSVESNEETDKKYLTEQQFSCIKEQENITIVEGCAGSGKTLVGIRKILMAEERGLKAVYVTNSKYLCNASQELYQTLSNKKNSASFYTLQGLCLEYLNMDELYLVSENVFTEWLTRTYQKEISYPSHLLWQEITDVIKGMAELGKELISLQQYKAMEEVQAPSQIREAVYGAAIAYQKWMNKNNYYDLNDLINMLYNKSKGPLFDVVIFDEAQELNEKAALLVKSICSRQEETLFLGDEYQRINHRSVGNQRMTSVMQQDAKTIQLSKNYRNGNGIIAFLNQVKQLDAARIHVSGKPRIIIDEPVKSGEKPYLVMTDGEASRIFEEVSKDIEAAVIVGNSGIKSTLFELGYNTERVFTVEEIRGMEYLKVYCYRLFEYANVNDAMNAIYIAVSRSKGIIYLLEKADIMLPNEFNEFCHLISEDEMCKDVRQETDQDIWLEEAKKLEKCERYEQAIVAYQNAGDSDRAMVCRKAMERKSAFLLLEEYGCYIDVSLDQFEKPVVTELLRKLQETHGIAMQSWIELAIYHTDGLVRIFGLYIENASDYEKVASCIEEKLKGNHYLKTRFALRVQNGESGHSDLLVKISNKVSTILEASCVELRRENEQRKFAKKYYFEQYGIIPKSDIQIIEDTESTTAAEDALAFIFG